MEKLTPSSAMIRSPPFENAGITLDGVATSYEYRMACGVPMNREISSSHLMCTSMEP